MITKLQEDFYDNSGNYNMVQTYDNFMDKDALKNFANEWQSIVSDAINPDAGRDLYEGIMDIAEGFSYITDEVKGIKDTSKGLKEVANILKILADGGETTPQKLSKMYEIVDEAQGYLEELVDTAEYYK